MLDSSLFTLLRHDIFRSLRNRPIGISNNKWLEVLNSSIICSGPNTIVQGKSTWKDLGNLIISEDSFKLCFFRGRSESGVTVNSLQESFANYYIRRCNFQVQVKLSTLRPLNAVCRPHYLSYSSIRQRDGLEHLSTRIIDLEWTMILRVPISREND